MTQSWATDPQTMAAPAPKPRTRTEPAAMTSLVLALGSLIVPVFPAVVALALAVGARRNIKASKGLRTGTVLVIAAVVISLLTLLVNAILLGVGFLTHTG